MARDPRTYGRRGTEDKLRGPIFGATGLLLFLVAWFTLGYGMTWWQQAQEVAIPSMIGFVGMGAAVPTAVVLGGMSVRLRLYDIGVVLAGLAGVFAALLVQYLIGFAIPPQASSSIIGNLPIPFLVLWFASFGISEEFQWGALVYNVAVDAWGHTLAGEIMVMLLTVVGFSIFHTAVIFSTTGGALFGAYGINYYVVTAAGRALFNLMLRLPKPLNHIAVPAIAHGGLNAIVIVFAACAASGGCFV